MNQIKVLFVIKERKVYGIKSACYGLVNSCEFVANALKLNGIDAKVVQVIDNNGIDKEVYNYKPTHCFIEALWVVPSKFKELARLHPKVKWMVRIHSMIPFLVSEGMSFDWINEYKKLKTKHGINIEVTCNNYDLLKDLHSVYKNITYTPNIYKPDYTKQGDCIHVDTGNTILNIGCFGALRLLKNHAQQAFYGIEFANKLKKRLHFHVNVSEHETNETSPVLKNLRAIFKNTHHKLIEHSWMPHEDFIQLVKQMNFGMQLTFTETFNIVAADFVGMGVPIVVSKEIDFINPLTRIDLSNRNKVLCAMYIAYYGRNFGIQNWDRFLLDSHNEKSITQWINVLKNTKSS